MRFFTQLKQLFRSRNLRDLIFIQAAIVVAGLAGLTFVVQSVLAANNANAVEKKRIHMRHLMAPIQEQWRSWQEMGMDDILGDAMAQFAEQYQLKKIAVVERDSFHTDQPGYEFLVPQSEDHLSDYAIAIELQDTAVTDAYNTNFILFAVSFFLAVLFIATNLVFLLVMARSSKARERDAEYRAIAQTTQMFAHDVRKPFGQLNQLIRLLRDADPNDTKGLCNQLLPAVQKSMRSVDGMIQNILKAGPNPSQKMELVDLRELLQTSLDVLTSQSPDETSIHRSFNHQGRVPLCREQFHRVIQNVLDNAREAAGPSGDVWIKTTEDRSHLTLTIGNSNSFVPPHHRRPMFEVFFTHGKKNGTGLGLAIAKKIVLAHGGQIWCESDQQKGTEIKVKLPRHPAAPEQAPQANQPSQKLDPLLT